ncbi:hypothetical protein C6P44_003582 [Monosporozyma unispora]|nr:hypothetical protein C6P44_003582 [Kazachstania unispora]
MGLKTIFIARHGFNAAWNKQEEEESFLIPPTGIPGDTKLSPNGVLQSKELAHYLLSLDTQPDLVVSSPYYRCVETAYHITKLLDVPLYTDRGLGKWFDYDNTTSMTSVLGETSLKRKDVYPPSGVETLNKLFKNSIKSGWEDCINPYSPEVIEKKGETQQEMYERTRQFLQILARQLDREMPDAESILLVTHAPIKISLGLNLLGFKDTKEVTGNEENTLIRSGCCSLDKYELEDSGISNTTDNDNRVSLLNYAWRITMNGNTVFLRNGEEMPWSFKKFLNSIKDHTNDDVEEQGETETIYVSLDLNSGFYKDRMTIEKNSTFQYSGLNQDKPLFRIGNKLYEGEWSQLVGTELAFPNEAVLHKRNRNITNAATEGDDEDEGDERDANDISEDDQETNERVKSALTEGNAPEKELNEYNLIIDTDKHGEVIYRIKDRIGLAGLHPV